MKKLFLSVVVVFSVAFSLSAQSQTQPESQVEIKSDSQPKAKSQSYDFSEGWFVNIAGGLNSYAGEHTRQLKAKSIVSYAADFSVGKWFNPYIAARLSFADFNVRGATFESYIKQENSGAPVHIGDAGLKKRHDRGAEWLLAQEFNAMNLHADFMYNLSNLFGSVDMLGLHFWNAIPYVGLGFPYALSSRGKSTGIPLDITVGFYNSFPLSDKIEFTTDFRGVLLDEGFDGEVGGLPLEFYTSFTVGVTYIF